MIWKSVAAVSLLIAAAPSHSAQGAQAALIELRAAEAQVLRQAEGKPPPEAIVAVISGDTRLYVRGGPASINWSADEVIVAPSGDLGITFGLIRPNAAPAAGHPAGAPFFTIWMRDGPDQPWRYVAE